MDDQLLSNSEPKSVGIKIKNLYKIFGPSPDQYLDAVRDGISKQELRDLHGHVLGLRDINLDIPAGGIQVVMGLSGSGKSTLVRHINRLIEPTAGEIVVGTDDVLKMTSANLLSFRDRKSVV